MGCHALQLFLLHIVEGRGIPNSRVRALQFASFMYCVSTVLRQSLDWCECVNVYAQDAPSRPGSGIQRGPCGLHRSRCLGTSMLVFAILSRSSLRLLSIHTVLLMYLLCR